MARKTNRPKLASDLRRLRAECTTYVRHATFMFDNFYESGGFLPPKWPELRGAGEPRIDPELVGLMVLPQNICQHALGGMQRTPNEPECVWCMAKVFADDFDAVLKFNAHIGQFLNRLNDVDAQKTDHSHDDDRGYSFHVSVAYDAKTAILTRAAKAWILAHPPPPVYQATPGRPVYQAFCTTRLINFKCRNPRCLDCQSLIWYTYMDEALKYVSAIAEFNNRMRDLGKSWRGEALCLITNIESHPKRRCFSFVGTRKRKVMNDFLAWARITPMPDFDVVSRRLRAGPGNDEWNVHPFCHFFSCTDESCDGLH